MSETTRPTANSRSVISFLLGQSFTTYAPILQICRLQNVWDILGIGNHNTDTHDVEAQSADFPGNALSPPRLRSEPLRQRRNTIASLLSLYPDLIPPPPPLAYHLTFTSCTAFYPPDSAWATPANNASAALSSFYGAIISLSSQLEQQKFQGKSAMAFGASRLWINFYGGGEQGLAWRDLEWVAKRAKGWAERGLVGAWDGRVWLDGGRGSVRVMHANDTLPLLPRGSWEGGDPKIASFTSPSCTTASRLGKYKSGWDCIKFTPGTDNVGINWGNTRAKGIDFFTDDNCNDYATKTVFSMDLGSDNGKGKADKCVHFQPPRFGKSGTQKGSHSEMGNSQVPSADTQNAIDEQTRCWSTEACDGSTVSSVAVQRKQSDEEDANGRGMSHALHQWLGQKPKQEPWAPFPAPEAGAASSENTSKKKQGKAMNRQRTNASHGTALDRTKAVSVQPRGKVNMVARGSVNPNQQR
ncbi:MAG: hypothetical protein LQ338_000865 [Usnochroma carphineum]|nr:MAG: hypothetical protein LQ338_000865 [Usnochroma carphineum]